MKRFPSIPSGGNPRGGRSPSARESLLPVSTLSHTGGKGGHARDPRSTGAWYLGLRREYVSQRDRNEKKDVSRLESRTGSVEWNPYASADRIQGAGIPV
jgi:hypothetical protein